MNNDEYLHYLLETRDLLCFSELGGKLMKAGKKGLFEAWMLKESDLVQVRKICVKNVFHNEKFLSLKFNFTGCMLHNSFFLQLELIKRNTQQLCNFRKYVWFKNNIYWKYIFCSSQQAALAFGEMYISEEVLNKINNDELTSLKPMLRELRRFDNIIIYL